MNNKRNTESIFSFKFFHILVLSCLISLLFFSNIGCEIISGEDDPIVDTADVVETEDKSDEESTEIQEDTNSGGESQEEAVTEEYVPEENGEESLPGSEEEKEDEADNNESITIRIYYADEMGEFLVGESRVLSYEQRHTDALIELLKVPIDSKLIPLVPETTLVYSVIIEEGVAKIDLSKNFIDDRFIGDTADILLIYSIVNTLTEFPDINAVAFYIEGEKIDTLGALDISEPLFRKSDLIVR